MALRPNPLRPKNAVAESAQEAMPRGMPRQQGQKSPLSYFFPYLGGVGLNLDDEAVSWLLHQRHLQRRWFSRRRRRRHCMCSGD